MHKQSLIIQASFQSALDTSLDYERKRVWDQTFYDVQVLYQSNDNSHRQIYYSVKSSIPLVVDDRDFLIDEHYRANYPEENMYTYIQ